MALPALAVSLALLALPLTWPAAAPAPPPPPPPDPAGDVRPALVGGGQAGLYVQGSAVGPAVALAYGGCWHSPPARLELTLDSLQGPTETRTFDVVIETFPDMCYLNVLCFFPTPYVLRITALDRSVVLEGPGERCEEGSVVHGIYEGGLLVAVNPWSPLRLGPP